MADINRLKVVRVDKKWTSYGLAEQLYNAPAIVSKRGTYSICPSLDTLKKTP